MRWDEEPADGDRVHVVVLAAGGWEDDAGAAFRADAPSSLADAARVAAAVGPISRRGPRAAG